MARAMDDQNNETRWTLGELRALNDAARKNAERALRISVRRNLARWRLTGVQPAPPVSEGSEPDHRSHLPQILSAGRPGTQTNSDTHTKDSNSMRACHSHERAADWLAGQRSEVEGQR